jgi:hypothetical protein
MINMFNFNFFDGGWSMANMLTRSQTNINEFNALKFAFCDYFMANMLSLFVWWVLGGGGGDVRGKWQKF